jgi:two-component system, OmpR family, sensor histidine kinase BaeS
VWWDARSQQRAAAEELMEHARGLAEWPGWVQRCEADPATWSGGGPQGGRGERPPPGPWKPREPASPTGRPAPGAPGGPPPEEADRSRTSRLPPPMRDGERGAEPGGGRPPPGPPPPSGPRGPRDERAGLRHRQPAKFFAYAADLTSPNPAAPPLSAALLAELAERDAVQVATPWQSSTVRVLVRVPMDSQACAYVLAQGTTEPWLGGILPPTHLWLLPLLAVMGVVLLAVGPVVRRLQQLTRAAHHSEQSDYVDGVDLGGNDEIAELARSLDGAARRVRGQLAETERRELALREFVANTTHDIMIPLTVLQGHLSALGRGDDGGVLPSAMDEAHYLGALIHNLAMAAKLDAAAAEPSRAPVDLGALVERVVMRHRAIARGLEIAMDHAVPSEPVVADGDVTMLEQAVTNLVYNAIRHNRAGGHVAIVLERERAAGAFTIQVIDDGPGVPDEELPRLGERGYRGNAARSRTPEGRGLGLDIVRRVAELHGLSFELRRSEQGGLHAELRGMSAVVAAG